MKFTRRFLKKFKTMPYNQNGKIDRKYLKANYQGGK